VGRELARVLGCRQSGAGCIEGSGYVVTWALGHLVTLADSEHYGDQYKKWDLETLPVLPTKLDTVVIKETSKQFNVVKNLLHREDISELVIATDAGRAGWLVLMVAHYPGWTVSVDGKPAALRDADGYLAADLLPGRRLYVFAFRPLPFRVGLLLSLAGVFATAWILVRDGA
jgi:hypothetical protein